MFEPDTGITWLQTSDTVTITVPSDAKPEVKIDGKHLLVTGREGILLDKDLGGDVCVEDSTWTFADGFLSVELSKKGSWWPMAVVGGQTGPEDPQKPKGPEMQKLESKIGEQVVGKKDFEGKSKFQW